jgi:DUF1680 family protein
LAIERQTFETRLKTFMKILRIRTFNANVTLGKEALVAAFLVLGSAMPAYCSESSLAVNPPTPAQLFPLSDVRLLPSYFTQAVAANREYVLSLDPDRLLAPFLREAGLKMKKEPYPNWESEGLDGHTAGHYLSALSHMIASGEDPDGRLGQRLDYMLSEMERVQNANGNGYIGGVPGSQEFWKGIAAGDIGLVWKKWVPWYNVHKTFAGLRDAYLEADRPLARQLLVKLGDWCVNTTSNLTEIQMQSMLNDEYGGMNEVMADIYRITGDKKYLKTAERFNHHAVIDPLMRGEDKLTGLHANTQIPKIIGLEEIATLTDNQKEDFGARFFWKTVVEHRSVAFGGNSVSEHFNSPTNFEGMLENREGPETCNTYNMLHLTEKLFATRPEARYADYYERALYNHILSAINVEDPGYVYFTPIRPEHYRVYSQPDESFWCCVGTGMENPGRYGQFIYARSKDGLYVNLFIPSVLKTTDGITLRQENKFPFEPRTHLSLKLDKPANFVLRIRHPWWVPAGQLAIRVNGQSVDKSSQPSTYAGVRREWHDGDTIDVELPMHITVDPLPQFPDGTKWAAILDGPIVLAAADGTNNMVGERAGPGRMSHVPSGPMVPLDKVPLLLTTAKNLPKHIVPDPEAGPMRFRITDVVEPKTPEGMEIMPFFQMHDVRYQMYWELTTAEGLKKRMKRLAAEEEVRAAREAATLDVVKPGEQQSEVEHDYSGDGTRTGMTEGRHWRAGQRIQYTLNTRGEKVVDLAVTYWGGDRGRIFDIFANDKHLATQKLRAEKPGQFVEKRYSIPAGVISAAPDRRMTIKFVADVMVAGGIFDVRLMKPGAPLAPQPR